VDLRVRQVEREIALRFGFRDFTDYFRNRRARGWGYNRIARETGQNRDWVRRARLRHEPSPARQVS
jgi:hypothetical protein